MKAIALANRLARYLTIKSVVDLDAEGRQAIMDAINGGLQLLHSLAPPKTKITTGSLYLENPSTVTIGVTNGSTAITGATFTDDQYGRTIRVYGDNIDNQVAGSSTLLHAYGGPTGTVTATVYSDAVGLPEIYSELAGDPRILETGRELINDRISLPIAQTRSVAEPRFYWVEPNAENNESPAPAIVRFDTLPNRPYRLSVQVMLAPARVSFSDLLAPGPELSLRAEHIELYLFPIALGLLTTYRLWENKETISATITASEKAESAYKLRTPSTLGTRRNRVGTRPGY